MKKAQISIFIVIGIIIIFGTGFLIINNSTENSSEINSDNPSIQESTKSSKFKLQIDDCVDKTTQETINHIAMSGGYYKTNQNSLEYYEVEIPIYLENSNKQIPTIENIQEEMSMYFNENIHSCIDKINLSETNFSYENDKIKTIFKILDQEIKIQTNIPITVNENGQVNTYSTFKVNKETQFKNLYELSNEYVEIQLQDENYVLNSKITQFANENNIKIELIYFDDDSIIYSFIKEENGENLIYNFAINYIWQEITI